MKRELDNGKLAKAIKAELEGKLTAIGELVSSDAKKLAPVDMGNLRESIKHQVIGTTVRISANTEYAAIQEFGGEVSAKRAKYLTFRTKDGKWHRAKRVNIPAHPYLRPAVTENEKNILEIAAL